MKPNIETLLDIATYQPENHSGTTNRRLVSAGAVVRISPGLPHEVTSLGPDDLELLIVYSPPISK